MKFFRAHIVLLGVFLLLFFAGLNAQYPLLGHDYFYYWPRLLEGTWYFLRQGIVPLRWAIHLCGGFPQYGNPQDLFYSLPQFLSFFLPLWPATQLSILTGLILGYIGWVRFGHDALKLSSSWAHTLALVCTANGFFFMHAAAGHLAYFTLPLMSWVLWAVFDARRETLWGLVGRTCIVALVTGTFLYSGTYVAPFLIVPIILALLPLDLALRSESLRTRSITLLRRFLPFTVVSLMLGASKLVAVYSLMRVLPRISDLYQYTAGQPILFFMLKSLWIFPQFPSFFTLDPNRIHEESLFTSPVALIGIVLLLVFCLRHSALNITKKVGLIIYTIVVAVLVLGVAHGSGFIAEAFHALPLISSLRVPERFLLVFALLCSIGGVLGCFLFIAKGRFAASTERIALGASALTVVAFVIAYTPLVWHTENTLPYDQIQSALRRDPNPLLQPVLGVQDFVGVKISDFQYLFNSSTGSRCYEPLLGENTFAPLRDGPVNFAWDGATNVYNPACIQYGAENNCEPGDRIAIEDLANLQHFINGEPTTWKISVAQMWADGTSLVTLIALIVVSGASVARYVVQKRKTGN